MTKCLFTKTATAVEQNIACLKVLRFLFSFVLFLKKNCFCWCVFFYLLRKLKTDNHDDDDDVYDHDHNRSIVNVSLGRFNSV